MNFHRVRRRSFFPPISLLFSLLGAGSRVIFPALLSGFSRRGAIFTPSRFLFSPSIRSFARSFPPTSSPTLFSFSSFLFRFSTERFHQGTRERRRRGRKKVNPSRKMVIARLDPVNALGQTTPGEYRAFNAIYLSRLNTRFNEFQLPLPGPVISRHFSGCNLAPTGRNADR